MIWETTWGNWEHHSVLIGGAGMNSLGFGFGLLESVWDSDTGWGSHDQWSEKRHGNWERRNAYIGFVGMKRLGHAIPNGAPHTYSQLDIWPNGNVLPLWTITWYMTSMRMHLNIYECGCAWMGMRMNSLNRMRASGSPSLRYVGGVGVSFLPMIYNNNISYYNTICVYTYIYIYIHIYTYTHVCIYNYIYMHTSRQVWDLDSVC